jgi:bla regulator protein blaR1
MVRSEDGKPVKIDVSGDADAPFVKTIQKDGKTIVLRTNKELSDAEVEKLVADAENSRAEAEAAAGEAEAARGEAEAARGEAEAGQAEAEAALAEAEAEGARAVAIVSNMNVSSYIPEIDIREFRGKCKGDQPVTTDVQGFDGQNRSRVKIVMCGKGMAKTARVEAVQGLRQAVDDIQGEEDMPESIRKDVVKKLNEQIKRLEKQIDADKDDA